MFSSTFAQRETMKRKSPNYGQNDNKNKTNETNRFVEQYYSIYPQKLFQRFVAHIVSQEQHNSFLEVKRKKINRFNRRFQSYQLISMEFDVIRM